MHTIVSEKKLDNGEKRVTCRTQSSESVMKCLQDVAQNIGFHVRNEQHVIGGEALEKLVVQLAQFGVGLTHKAFRPSIKRKIPKVLAAGSPRAF